MQRPNFHDFFDAYAELYNKALSDAPDYEGIAACFTDCFLAAGPSGVQCGHNDEGMLAQLKQGYDFYRDIGTKRMSVTRTLETQIDDLHNLVKVFYRADYEKDGKPIRIDFDVTYLMQTCSGVSKICAFISGDEMAAYKRAGLVD